MTSEELKKLAIEAADITKEVLNRLPADANSTGIFDDIFANLLAIYHQNAAGKRSG